MQNVDSNNKYSPEIISVGELLKSSDTYFIPLYQRDYAWGSEEVRQLINDIAAACFHPTNNNQEKRYHIGSLVLSRIDNGFLEVVDGQQRLTTLHLLNAALENFCEVNKGDKDAVNLHFSSFRAAAEHFIRYVYRKHDDLSIDISHVPVQMLSVYNNIQCIWNEVLGNYGGTTHEETVKKFIANSNETTDEDKLKNIIAKYCRTIPEGILKDFNGKTQEEQLKIIANYGWTIQEGILKDFIVNNVKIVKVFLPEGTDLNRYFEATNSRGEQLEKHEILKARLMKQLNDDNYGEQKNEFSRIWDSCSDMSRFYSENMEMRATERDNNEETLEYIISNECKSNEENTQVELSEEGQSVIDFSNFLMLALRIFTQNQEIPLDDTLLLDKFHEHLEKTPENIMNFVRTLKELREAFDEHIICSYNGQWHIGKKSINTQQQEENSELSQDKKRLFALQTMFNSAYPSHNYKYWLYYALQSALQSEKINSVEFWEKMARKFLGARYISEPKDYSVIMDGASEQKIDESRLQYGFPVVFALKLFEYILWSNSNRIKYGLQFSSDRNSIEHFYPQHPIENYPKLGQNFLDQFGNLCLVSSSMNSRLTNNMPEAKCANFERLQHKSIKLELMMKQCKSKERPWHPIADASNINATIEKNTTLAVNVFNAFLLGDNNKISEAVNAVFHAYGSSDDSE